MSRRTFDPVSLRLFVAVCEQRNIASAAKREAIVPSALSKRISQMEDLAGVRLLDRGRRGVNITPAGETLWRYARESLQLADRMQAELGAFANGVQGHVRVFASMSAVAQFLPADVSSFAKNYRDVRVSIEEREIWEVVRGVVEGRADIAVCWDAVDLRGLKTLPYHNDHLAVVLHPDHPLSKKRAITFEDTIDHEHVDIVGRSIMKATQQKHAAAAGKLLHYRIQVSNVPAACAIVAANLALAIVPFEEVMALRDASKLKVVPLKNAWARRRFVIAVREEAALGVPAHFLAQSLSDSAKLSGRTKGRPPGRSHAI